MQATFPRRNWAIAIASKVLVNVAYVITVPSMHQYITNPGSSSSSAARFNGSSAAGYGSQPTVIPPGLERSENFYTWAVAMYSIGELVAALLVGPMTRVLPYRCSFLLSLVPCLVGFLFYAFSTAHWFWLILIGRLLVGMHCGFDAPLVLAYLSKTTSEETERKLKTAAAAAPEAQNSARNLRKAKKVSLKDRVFIAYAFVDAGAYMIGPVIGAFVSHVMHVDPYRWPAWFMAGVTAVFMVIFLATFKETEKFHCSKCRTFNLQFSTSESETGKKNYSAILGVAILVASSYVIGGGYTLVDALVNPILSDHFGFRVADISFFMLGSMAMLVGGSILLLILKELHVSSRLTFMFCLVCMFIGAVLMADWQALGDDPCYYRGNRTDFSRHGDVNLSLFEEVDVKRAGIVFDATECQARSTPFHNCYWNQLSQITGKICVDCAQICRSVDKALNFVQFSVGTALYMVAVPLAIVLLALIGSDVAPVECQGTVQGSIIAASGLSRMITPLWNDPLYEGSGKHTYAVMAVTAGIVTLNMIVFSAYFKHFKPAAAAAETKTQSLQLQVVYRDCSGEEEEEEEGEGGGGLSEGRGVEHTPLLRESDD